MAELLRAVDDEVDISYGVFDLLDTCGLLDGATEETGSLEVGVSHVEIRTTSGARHASVRLEAWSEEPPPPDDLWITRGEAAYLSVTGIVSMSGSAEGPGEKLLIGPPFFAYGLRICSAPAAERDEHGRPVAEPWLLRFWPLCDASGPVIDAESMTLGESALRMTELLPLDPAHTDVTGDWPALRPLPEPEILPGWSTTSYRPLVDGEDGEYDEYDEEEVGEMSRYVPAPHADLRIAAELNPDGQPTLLLGAGDVSLPFGGTWPGFSGRAWVWSPDDSAHPEVLGTARQVITRDRIRRRALVTGVVTILMEESGQVEVRAATAAEAERVLAAEGIRT